MVGERKTICELLKSHEEMEKVTEDLIHRNELREKEFVNIDRILSNLIKAVEGDADIDEELLSKLYNSMDISSQGMVDKLILANEKNLENKLSELASRVLALKKSELALGQ